MSKAEDETKERTDFGKYFPQLLIAVLGIIAAWVAGLTWLVFSAIWGHEARLGKIEGALPYVAREVTQTVTQVATATSQYTGTVVTSYYVTTAVATVTLSLTTTLMPAPLPSSWLFLTYTISGAVMVLIISLYFSLRKRTRGRSVVYYKSE